MKRALQRLADQIAASLDCRLIPTWRLERLALAQRLREIFQHYAIDTVVDVGANAGQYHDFLRGEVGFGGVIHSFEPLSYLVKSMRERQANDAAWHVHQFALGNQSGNCNINVMASDTFSSLRSVASDAPAQFAESTRVESTQSIEIRRLDDLRVSLGLAGRRTYLKIDTQGFDLEVIRGAQESLADIHALQVELAFQRIYQGVPDYREVLTLLEEWGYVVSAMFPISQDQRLAAVELDCVLVRAGPHVQAQQAEAEGRVASEYGSLPLTGHLE